MKKVLHSEAVYYYEAEDGRKFQKPEDCEQYEFYCQKWLNQRRVLTDPEGSEYYCYPVTSYGDILEIQNFDKMHEWNYPAVHPQESYYELPGWVYVPDSSSMEEYPDLIQPLSYMEECIADTEKAIAETKAVIAQLRGEIFQ